MSARPGLRPAALHGVGLLARVKRPVCKEMSVDGVHGLVIAGGLYPWAALRVKRPSRGLLRPSARASTSLERTWLSLLRESPRRFSEILAQVELPRLHLHRDLTAQHLDLPPSRTDCGANAERWVFENFASQFPGNGNVLASRRHPIDHPSRKGFFGAEESSGQRHFVGKCTAPT